MVSLNLRDRSGEKIKDGRHVGLDFYDLLIVFTSTHALNRLAAVSME
jgi:hypothetical protein